MLLFLCRGSLYRFIPLNPDPNKAGKNWKHFSPLKLIAEKIRPQETLESPNLGRLSLYMLIVKEGRKSMLQIGTKALDFTLPEQDGTLPSLADCRRQKVVFFLSQGHDGRLYKTDMRFRGAVSAVSGKKVWSCSVSARIPSHHRRSLKKNTDCRSRCCPTRSML